MDNYKMIIYKVDRNKICSISYDIKNPVLDITIYIKNPNINSEFKDEILKCLNKNNILLLDNEYLVHMIPLQTRGRKKKGYNLKKFLIIFKENRLDEFSLWDNFWED